MSPSRDVPPARSRPARSASSPTCSPPRARRRRPTSRSSLFEDETWTYAEAAREAWRAAHALQTLGVGIGDYVSVWMPTGPDVLRAWFGANAVGAVYAPLNLAARGTYLEHTLNLAEAKVLVAHHQLVERLAGLDLPNLEQSSSSAAPPDVDLPWPTVTLDELLDGVSRRAPRARAADRAVGRPQPDLHVRHDRAPRRASARRMRRSGTTPTASSCRTSTRTTATCNSLPMFHTAGNGDHLLDALAGGSVALNEGLQPEHVLGRRAALRRDDHDRDPRHGHVHARPAGRRTTPTTRCASSTWARCRGTRSSRGASAARSTPPTG